MIDIAALGGVSFPLLGRSPNAAGAWMRASGRCSGAAGDGYVNIERQTPSAQFASLIAPYVLSI
ncbi:MAG: hypothetical protein A2140_01915 [Candidatus Muproteobacteria bacterium RBG_16_62_13]|uniref:Uncharacterized protein n=1 Tax=Candidatus Muproteobacteria bacterium RBG_16_62_13 TaxID=1817756 RepID=A0A1F6SXD6_9PROT|nr:MAG: hypothetical protein A2140_01915 [Candidatus Muproteobacteria bacterium RBG_16_62_13]